MSALNRSLFRDNRKLTLIFSMKKQVGNSLDFLNFILSASYLGFSL